MAIKATFPAGQTALTVHGLHQWDYGQKLEIEAPDLPGLVEVHFACAGMQEAVVRSCAVVDGKTEAVIPDQCLEQTSPVLAWVYVVDKTAGETVRTIVMPIVARTKPQAGASVPTQVSNRYTEVVAGMNTLLEEAEKAGEENVTALNAIIDQFNKKLAAAPQLNTAKKLTEGSGFYYIKTDTSSGGIVYWEEGKYVALPADATIVLSEAVLGVGYIQITADGALGYYTCGYDPSPDTDATNGWYPGEDLTSRIRFYTKKIA